jgi:hypothetical protein
MHWLRKNDITKAAQSSISLFSLVSAQNQMRPHHCLARYTLQPPADCCVLAPKGFHGSSIATVRVLAWHKIPIHASERTLQRSLVGRWLRSVKPYDGEILVPADEAWNGLSTLLTVFVGTRLDLKTCHIVAHAPSSRSDSSNRVPPRLVDQLCMYLQMPKAEPETIRLLREIQPMKSIDSFSDRQHEIRGRMTADPSRFSGKRVLLIDDVLDSGATIRECARALEGAGAKSVHVVTLTKTAAFLAQTLG